MTLALTLQSGIRIAEVGFLFVALAGAAIAADVLMPSARKNGAALGGICLAIAGVLLIVATHWGHF